jgi:hypothetical protein
MDEVIKLSFMVINGHSLFDRSFGEVGSKQLRKYRLADKNNSH